MKEKMLYIMNVDWHWIKQRPHFIAEGLAEKFDLTVVYQYRYSRKNLQKKDSEKVSVKPMYLIPKLDRYKYLKNVNIFLKKLYFRRVIQKLSPEYIYTTFPNQIDVLPKKFQGRVIYDCMDNHAEFLSNASDKTVLMDKEKLLIKRANYVLVSSNKLRQVISEQYDYPTSRIQVVRNGYYGDIMDVNLENNNSEKKFRICYFGTISDWFNFDFILKSLDDLDYLEYILIGPTQNVSIPDHERLKYIGTVEHDKLFETTKNMDCFIMPFKVNELIEAVDPVKLYEYINFNKNIICIKYQEIDRFSKYVYFYTDYDSFINQIKNVRFLKNKLKYSNDDRLHFLEDNSWDARVQQINKILESDYEYEKF